MSPDHSEPERTFAPDVDPKWAEDFIVALRLRGVGGVQIGEALAEVNDHVKTSGKTATEVFGEPASYAKEIDLPVSPDQSTGAMLAAVAPVIVQVVAMNLVLVGLPALRRGIGAELAIGSAITLVLTIAVMTALALFAEPVLTAAIRRPAIWIVISAAVIAICVVPMAIWRQPISNLPPMPLTVTGLVLMAVATYWIITHTADDAITLPTKTTKTTKNTTATTPARPGTASRPSTTKRRNIAMALFVPAGCLILGLLTWLTG